MRAFSVVLPLILLAPRPAPAQEPVAKSKIVAAGLFKNGLAVIKREIALPGPGTYRLEDLPEPVHGTWWIESTQAVETTVKTREIELPAGGDIFLQRDLSGRKVTIHFKVGKLDPVTGVVLQVASPKEEPMMLPDEEHGAHGARMLTAERTSRFLVLKTAKGRMYVDPSNIAILEAEGADDPVRKERRPILLVSAPKAGKDDKVYITYLTHGLAWAPSYRVDISDPKNLSIELGAIVKNELAGLENAELRLISGFPSVEFAHVRSPLSPRQTWESFFNQLTHGPARQHELLGQQVLANVRSSSQPAFGLAGGATAMGEGVDLHFQPIGKRTLAKGEALSLSIAKDWAGYERIVEWIIPDNRDEHGRYRNRGEQVEHDSAWDALRFKNPFKFPMTTGPAMVTANGQFNGQRTSYYVSAGEETMLRITKALSVRTRQSEHEATGKNAERDYVYVGGNRYQKSTVEGELIVSNHRQEEIKVVVRRRFSGELVGADGDPRTMLREEGVYSVNKRNELLWTVPLKGGEERRLTYRYTVLVYI